MCRNIRPSHARHPPSSAHLATSELKASGNRQRSLTDLSTGKLTPWRSIGGSIVRIELSSNRPSTPREVEGIAAHRSRPEGPLHGSAQGRTSDAVKGVFKKLVECRVCARCPATSGKRQEIDAQMSSHGRPKVLHKARAVMRP